ncbi:hypothetical protein V8C86DRAFT_501101 [Haematococcus lacustris]
MLSSRAGQLHLVGQEFGCHSPRFSKPVACRPRSVLSRHQSRPRQLAPQASSAFRDATGLDDFPSPQGSNSLVVRWIQHCWLWGSQAVNNLVLAVADVVLASPLVPAARSRQAVQNSVRGALALVALALLKSALSLVLGLGGLVLAVYTASEVLGLRLPDPSAHQHARSDPSSFSQVPSPNHPHLSNIPPGKSYTPGSRQRPVQAPHQSPPSQHATAAPPQSPSSHTGQAPEQPQPADWLGAGQWPWLRLETWGGSTGQQPWDDVVAVRPGAVTASPTAAPPSPSQAPGSSGSRTPPRPLWSTQQMPSEPRMPRPHPTQAQQQQQQQHVLPRQHLSSQSLPPQGASRPLPGQQGAHSSAAGWPTPVASGSARRGPHPTQGAYAGPNAVQQGVSMSGVGQLPQAWAAGPHAAFDGSRWQQGQKLQVERAAMNQAASGGAGAQLGQSMRKTHQQGSSIVDGDVIDVAADPL